MNTPSPTQRTPVHAESARIGARLAFRVIHGQFPADHVINQILSSGAELDYQEFPLEVVGMVSGQKLERRRVFAMKALEALLHHCGEATLVTDDDLDKLVSKSWNIARAMEREDEVAQQLESLGKKA